MKWESFNSFHNNMHDKHEQCASARSAAVEFLLQTTRTWVVSPIVPKLCQGSLPTQCVTIMMLANLVDKASQRVQTFFQFRRP
eukprot:2037166-Amphidinium_carterae.1